MIELSPLARPYAKAIFSAALDVGNHETVAKDLALLSAVSQTQEVTRLIAVSYTHLTLPTIA